MSIVGNSNVGALREFIQEELVDDSLDNFYNTDRVIDELEHQLYSLLNEHHEVTEDKGLEESYKDLLKRVESLAVGLY